MGIRVRFYHYEHRDAEQGFKLISRAKIPPIHFDFDFLCTGSVGDDIQKIETFDVRISDRPVACSNLLNFLKDLGLFAFIQEIKVQVNRVAVETVEQESRRPTLKPQVRCNGSIGINVLQDLKQYGFMF